MLNINKIFNICQKDILYVLEEGTIANDTDFYGKSLFNNEINNYNDIRAFTSAILLFNNCKKIRHLFNKINENISNRYHFFHNQPYIVYNAFKYNLYNNKMINADNN